MLGTLTWASQPRCVVLPAEPGSKSKFLCPKVKTLHFSGMLLSGLNSLEPQTPAPGGSQALTQAGYALPASSSKSTASPASATRPLSHTARTAWKLKLDPCPSLLRPMVLTALLYYHSFFKTQLRVPFPRQHLALVQLGLVSFSTSSRPLVLLKDRVCCSSHSCLPTCLPH